MPFNLGYLILDLVGTALFVIGAVGAFGGQGSLLPVGLQFPAHNYLLIGAGIVLMLPYMFDVFTRARHRAEAARER